MSKKKNTLTSSVDSMPYKAKRFDERTEEYTNPYLYVGKEPNLMRVGGFGSGKTRLFKKPNLMPKK